MGEQKLRFAAGIWHLFNEWRFYDRFAAARENGFSAVEITLPYNLPASELARVREKADIEVALFTAPLGDFMEGGEGIAAVPGREREFRASVDQALEYAAALQATQIQFVAGRCFGQDADLAKRERYLAQLVENVALALDAFRPTRTRLVFETINTREFEDYLLNRPEHLFWLLERVGAEELGAVLDTQHLALMGIDPVREMRDHGHRYCHIQIADAPERSQPGTGTIDFPAFYRAIRDSGYRGLIGSEYHPRDETVESLGWIAEADRIVNEGR
ncbi:MAG: TIM barrel protein [Deltaproteobacteria bacterium]|nr:TIM barrel protein [Deltaproteobacteria bacterium]MBW2499326.1 TIM barrel protein [Deltaproteobacteria bacterium]